MAAWQSNRTVGRFRARRCREAVPPYRWISCLTRPDQCARSRSQATQVGNPGRLRVDNGPESRPEISTEKRTSPITAPPQMSHRASLWPRLRRPSISPFPCGILSAARRIVPVDRFGHLRSACSRDRPPDYPEFNRQHRHLLFYRGGGSLPPCLPRRAAAKRHPPPM